ncbi:MAG: triple tyrosine motif-containing protein, partial [Flavobacteriales bacterium]
ELPVANEKSPRKISNKEIRLIHRDENNILWLGTADGISILDPSQQTFEYIFFNSETSCLYLIKDRNTNQYYGLNLYNKRQLTLYDEKFNAIESWPIPEADAKSSEPVSLYQDNENQIWIGTIRSGTWRFNPVTHVFQKIKFATSITEDQDILFVEDFLEIDQTHMWLALRNLGAAKYNKHTHQLDLIKGQAPFIGCQKFHRDAQNNIWGLSAGNGLIRFTDSSSSIDYVLPDKDFSDFIITPNNQLVATTKNHGLRVYEIASNKLNLSYELNTTNQFPSNNLSQISLGKDNVCWIQFKNSLIAFNIKTKLWKTYGAKDGLTGNLSFSELYVSPTGDIFLNYGNGVYQCNIKAASLTSKTPPLILKSIHVMDKVISGDFSNEIHLQHDENFLSFDFLALEYTKQHELTYAYQLVGLDKDWVISGSRHFAEYPDLKPGNYQFRIKVSNGDGIWSEPLQTITIIVDPAWYQTWLFRIFLAALLITMTILSIRQYLISRFRKKLKQLEYQRNLEQVRNRIARDIHDEIGSGLTKISLLTARLENNEVTERIKSSSKEIIDNLSDIIWAVNPANDSLQNFAAHLRDYTGRYFEETSCHAHLQIEFQSESIATITLSPDVKRNVMMIVKEAFNNILKHSHADSCEIHVQFSSMKMQIVIQDNGQSKKEKIPGSGNGILNMKKRANDMQGQLNWTQSDSGVRIELTIPLS